MSVLYDNYPLSCGSCPFIDCDERGTCYSCHCYLDKDLDNSHHCDFGGTPDECPLKKGIVITIKEIDGDIFIGKDYK